MREMISHVSHQAVQMCFYLGGRSAPRNGVLQFIGDSKQITMFRIDLGKKNLVLLAPSELLHT